MEISAKLVKDLREQTGAGMMKCKEALVECKGDFERAVDYLRKKGLASADKKSGRATSQGLIVTSVSQDGRTAVIAEVNCETDFVAKNETFVDFASLIAKSVMANKAISGAEALETAVLLNGVRADEERKSLIARIGENVTFGRVERHELAQGKSGRFDTYIHGEGNIGVLVKLSCSTADVAGKKEVKVLAHEVALQVAAMKPRHVDRTEVPQQIVEREKDVIIGQLQNDPKNANKPQDIINKIVEGRVDKYFKEFCLVEQLYIKDDTKTIKALAEQIGSTVGGTVTVELFRRWEIGEKTSEPKAEDCCEKTRTCCACSSH